MSEYTAQHSDFCDAVPIKVNRVYDSCCDKDCLKDIQVNLDIGELPCNINVVKSKCVRVSDVTMTVEPLPFNRGFYSIDLTFTFNIELYAYERSCEAPIVVRGTAFACKNCILYGSEVSTKTFFSNGMKIGTSGTCCEIVNLPTASVQVVEPIALETKIGKVCVCDTPDGSCCYKKTVIMTLGLFSVVELSRPTTILVPTFEYKIPHKECECETDDPCEMFEKIRFPIKEFNPDSDADMGKIECDDC